MLQFGIESLEEWTSKPPTSNELVAFSVPGQGSFFLYPRSVNRIGPLFGFIARGNRGRRLFLASKKNGTPEMSRFAGEEFSWGSWNAKICPLSNSNSATVRENLEFTSPRPLGLRRSYGMGDRLGLANPAHLRALQGSPIRPVLAQQSIRELDRTERNPEDVLAVATWAVLQEGYRDGYGADGDHLKTVSDVDRMLDAGYTMFTFDPGEFVENEADSLPGDRILSMARELPWNELETEYAAVVDRYANREINVTEGVAFTPDVDSVRRGLVKYGRVIAHVKKLAHHLNASGGSQSEIEVSVDETESVTKPFEHFLIVAELKRLGVEIYSVAPRFTGAFEKGIDYKGSREEFELDFKQHLAVAKSLGPYKLSLHSGSDKFEIYPILGRLAGDLIHVKTAGTSYLEALKATAILKPDLFREILEFSLCLYEDARASYHVSAEVDKVPPSGTTPDADLPNLVRDNDHVRQVLHVAFGDVLTARTESGAHVFRNRILNLLDQNEDVHFGCLIEHFGRHIDPFL